MRFRCRSDWYNALFDPIRAARQEKSGKQLGNPEKLAAAVLALVASDSPPPQLLLGSDVLKLVTQRMERLGRERSGWKGLPFRRMADWHSRQPVLRK